MKKKLIWMLVLPMLLTSCIKDEPLGTECDILSVWVDGEAYAASFYHPTQMRKDDIASNEQELVFTVRSLISLPREVPLHFVLTDGATISPANGSMQDFTQGPVIYTVTSQDGQWQRRYSVEFREAAMPTYKFSFENADEKEGTNGCIYNVFYEVDAQGTRHDIWASGNEGVTLVRQGMQPAELPTHSVADGFLGKGICLNTQYAGDLGKMFGKPIAAGNLYMGKFNVNNVLLDPLRTTEFGTPIDRVPVRVTGYYKYKAGAEFTNASMEVVPDRTDQAHIYAVFYRNQDASGKKVVLYGDDVLSSQLIVRKAEVASLPPTDEWTRFEMFFEGGEADPEVLSALGYNLTVVFSSSKDGAAFEGAIGSTLYVDEVEVQFENE